MVCGVVLGFCSVWVVEFFVFWCGYCIVFVLMWKVLVEDVKVWRLVLYFVVLDCVEEINSVVCRDFNIFGFLIVRFFKVFIKNGLGVVFLVVGVDV